jgi:CheY-like chemotaxis protein
MLNCHIQMTFQALRSPMQASVLMSLKGQTILLVEDEFLLALDLTATLEGKGAKVVTATKLADAFSLIEAGINGAIVDHVLLDGDSRALCERLLERGIPFVNYTGYDIAEGACQHGPTVAKPAPPEKVIAALQELL